MANFVWSHTLSFDTGRWESYAYCYLWWIMRSKDFHKSLWVPKKLISYCSYFWCQYIVSLWPNLLLSCSSYKIRWCYFQWNVLDGLRWAARNRSPSRVMFNSLETAWRCQFISDLLFSQWPQQANARQRDQIQHAYMNFKQRLVGHMLKLNLSNQKF